MRGSWAGNWDSMGSGDKEREEVSLENKLTSQLNTMAAFPMYCYWIVYVFVARLIFQNNFF